MKYYIDFLLLVIINTVVVCLLKLSPITKQKTDNNIILANVSTIYAKTNKQIKNMRLNYTTTTTR